MIYLAKGRYVGCLLSNCFHALWSEHMCVVIVKMKPPVFHCTQFGRVSTQFGRVSELPPRNVRAY